MGFKEAFSVAGAVIVSLGGGGAIVFGMSSWLGGVWAARILEEDRRKYQKELEQLRSELERTTRRAQAELDKTVFVHRLQFETEFRALSEVWKHLATVCSAIQAVTLRYFEIDIPRSGAEMAEAEAIRDFLRALASYRRVVDDNRPFLTETIFRQAEAASAAARSQAGLLPSSRQRDDDWYQDVRRGAGAVLDSAEEVVKVIRLRIAELALYPGEVQAESSRG